VGYSNHRAAYEITRCMIEAGYRRIAFVNGPSENNERARHRAEGYRAAMQAAGLSAPPIHVVHDESAIRPETGAGAIRTLLRESPDIDAVFFTSDVFAVGAIMACRELGIDIPGQMGIAGFHDLEIGRVVSPTLTTVHVPSVEMGRRAGEMIVARLSGTEHIGEREELGFFVLQRESTRRPSL
jgi:LacI family transcriptional regulator, gluconate utilization system Gnt-I transcriptional repressor